MEVLDRDVEARGVAADLVQREQPVPAVEGRVLDAFRVHRRRRLLEAKDERVVAALLEQQDARELRRQARLLDRLAIGVVDAAGERLDVGPVDGERRERRGQVDVEPRQQGLQTLRILLEGDARLPQLALARDLVEAARVTRDLLVERRQRLLAGRVDEERTDLVQELVARRPLDRPVAQLLAGLEDLLRPDVLDARLAQPLEVAARVREPVRMVDAEPVEQTVARQLEHLRVRDLPDLGILHPHARELADVEEAPVRARAPVEVEEPCPPERVAPERVLVRRRHVVRDDVEHDAQPRRRASPQARGTPPRLRAPPRSASDRRRRSCVEPSRACSEGER